VRTAFASRLASGASKQHVHRNLGTDANFCAVAELLGVACNHGTILQSSRSAVQYSVLDDIYPSLLQHY